MAAQAASVARLTAFASTDLKSEAALCRSGLWLPVVRAGAHDVDRTCQPREGASAGCLTSQAYSGEPPFLSALPSSSAWSRILEQIESGTNPVIHQLC